MSATQVCNGCRPNSIPHAGKELETLQHFLKRHRPPLAKLSREYRRQVFAGEPTRIRLPQPILARRFFRKLSRIKLLQKPECLARIGWLVQRSACHTSARSPKKLLLGILPGILQPCSTLRKGCRGRLWQAGRKIDCLRWQYRIALDRDRLQVAGSHVWDCASQALSGKQPAQRSR